MLAIKEHNLLTNRDHFTPCRDWVDACQMLRTMRAEMSLYWEENIDYTLSIEEVDNDFDFDNQLEWN